MPIIQFPDLTEGYANECAGIPITTQFAYCTTTPNTTEPCKKSLVKAGFKCVSSMNNWGHPVTVTTFRKLDLYWYRSSTLQIKPCVCAPVSWGGRSVGGRRLQATGCGFAVSDTLQHEHYWRFHTLMRMPVKPSKHQLQWLARCHYFKIDEGALSSYWVNGFDPDKYTWRLERTYWNNLKFGLDYNKSITPIRQARYDKNRKKVFDGQMAAYQNRLGIQCGRL